MDRQQQKFVDKTKKLADLTHELREKTGVQSVTPVEKQGLDGAITTVQALLNSGGQGELQDLMDRPRVTAEENARQTRECKEEQKVMRSRGRVSVRLRVAIPKKAAECSCIK